MAKDNHILSDLNTFHARLASWFGEHARVLPWRETSDPYHIWLSEIILQQTQVVQGMSYYYKFLELFPTIQDLAEASEDEVLRAWQGLGYYSRGRNLLKAAQMVMSDFGGVFPQTLSDIKRLPGVGPYTQAAVLSFAYDQAYAAVDGNVYRVLSRLFADATPIDSSQGQKHFQQRASEILNHSAPGMHNQAMIELGAMVCSPRKPDCMFCPVEAFCEAKHAGNPTNYPVKQGKIKVTERYLHFFLVRLPEGRLLIERRAEGDIWEGLYQFPLIETNEKVEGGLEALLARPEANALLSSLKGTKLHTAALAQRQHRLTHRLLHATLYEVEAEAADKGEYISIEASELDSYALPALLIKLIGGVRL